MTVVALRYFCEISPQISLVCSSLKSDRIQCAADIKAVEAAAGSTRYRLQQRRSGCVARSARPRARSLAAHSFVAPTATSALDLNR